MTEEGRPLILVIGYGNPSRQDDGLGPRLVNAIPPDLPGVAVEVRHSLMIEDAAEAANFDKVIFIDAAVTGPEPFRFQQLTPDSAASASSHHLNPGLIIQLAHTIYDSQVAGYLLAVRGYVFDGYAEELSDKAAINLQAAQSFLLPLLSSGDFPA